MIKTVRCDSGKLGDVRSTRHPFLVESSRCTQNKLLAQGAQTRSTMTPGLHRIVKLIGRQQTVQSSMNDCSRCEVSICNGKISPQCGQVISVSMTSSTTAQRSAWSSLQPASALAVSENVIASLCARQLAKPSLRNCRSSLARLVLEDVRANA